MDRGRWGRKRERGKRERERERVADGKKQRKVYIVQLSKANNVHTFELFLWIVALMEE